MSNSQYFLHPYLKQFKLFQDLCFFIDYLDIDTDELYNQIRYKYTDFEKLGNEGVKKVFKDLGADYITNLLEMFSNVKGGQLLGISNLLQLLKGDIRGVDILADILGFEYTAVQWWQKVPLGAPNTAEIFIYLDSSNLVADVNFQQKFIDFLKDYLYPRIDTKVYVDVKNEVAISCVATFTISVLSEEE